VLLLNGYDSVYRVNQPEPVLKVDQSFPETGQIFSILARICGEFGETSGDPRRRPFGAEGKPLKFRFETGRVPCNSTFVAVQKPLV